MSGAPRKYSSNTSDSQQPTIDWFRDQHVALAQRQIATEHGRTSVVVDEAESPLGLAGAAA